MSGRCAWLLVVFGCSGAAVGTSEEGSSTSESGGESSSSGESEAPTSEGGDDATTGEVDGCPVDWAGDLALGPAPVQLDEGLAVPIDIIELSARLTLDVEGKAAEVEALVKFRVGDAAGRPIFDLRQEPVGELDGEAIDALWTRDFGGSTGAEMRVLDREVAACSEHVLTLRYTLVRPPGFAADPPKFEVNGVAWDFAFNDVAPRMFLEQWLPANLVHDRHGISLALEIAGGAAGQRVISNGEVVGGEGLWQIDWPEDSTAQSPMLVLAPGDKVVSDSVTLDGVTFEVHRSLAYSEEPAAFLEVLTEAYAGFAVSTGAYRYPRFVAYVNKNAGMEYDGGTTSDIGALRHELFHSWYGRGVRPRRGADGWLDEAWTEYNTGTPALPAAVMDLADPPVKLCDDDPWSRTTSLTAYGVGKAVFAGIAAEAGVEPLRASMREFYAAHAGEPVTTQMVEQHLHCTLQVPAVRALFHRFVYGRQGEAAAASGC